jgi:hypothetical protein
VSKHLPALSLFCELDWKYLPTAVHVKQNLYIVFSVGVLAVYFAIVEAGNRGIIGELVVKVVLAGNQRGDAVLEIEVIVDGEA